MLMDYLPWVLLLWYFIAAVTFLGEIGNKNSPMGFMKWVIAFPVVFTIIVASYLYGMRGR